MLNFHRVGFWIAGYDEHGSCRSLHPVLLFALELYHIDRLFDCAVYRAIDTLFDRNSRRSSRDTCLYILNL